MSTAPDLLPGALAYALPFEGVHICVFYDRIQASGPAVESVLLGHVLAHEIGHILEGVPNHEQSGLMKAQWTTEEQRSMKYARMMFTSADVNLIHQGLTQRALRTTTATH